MVCKLHYTLPSQREFGPPVELPNTLWNVNFTTITRFPATLNADVFMKQLLLRLSFVMWAFGFAL